MCYFFFEDYSLRYQYEVVQLQWVVFWNWVVFILGYIYYLVFVGEVKEIYLMCWQVEFEVEFELFDDCFLCLDFECCLIDLWVDLCY